MRPLLADRPSGDRRSEDRPARVAVLATPFGFGPASKAHTIAQVLTREYGIEVHYYGSDSAQDFFDAQDGVRARRIGTAELQRDPDLLGSYGAIVNVLAPELITSHQTAAVTHYVDSLGFMWQPADLAADSPLKRVRAYFAQDLFGSVDNLTGLGVPGVVGVSGIVSPPALATGGAGTGPARALVNLGGLSNPAGNGSAHAYLPLAERLLGVLRGGAFELSVAMNRVNGFSRFASGSARQLSGTDFQDALAGCDLVFSSPGMTTLIETSQAGRPYVPLPPQNWSQVVICRHMSRMSGQEIWPFLAERYARIDAGAQEAFKADAVRQINRDLAADAGFALEYGCLAQRAAGSGEVPTVGAPFTGAQEVAAAVAEDLGVRRGAGAPSTKVGAR